MFMKRKSRENCRKWSRGTKWSGRNGRGRKVDRKKVEGRKRRAVANHHLTRNIIFD